MPRPDYLETYGVPPPSQSPKEKRATVEYRCERLLSLVNLYYWAMQWTIHAANNWELGERACEFDLQQKQLWALGLETLADVARQSWPAEAHRIDVTVRYQGGPQRTGRIALSAAKWGQERRSLTARAADGDKFDHVPPEFLHNDLVLGVDFPPEPDCVPWGLICRMLEQAYVNAESDLSAAKVEWGGPPFYEEFSTGQELLDDAEDRGLRPRVLLKDLEQRRRRLIRDVEAVWRAKAQDRKRRRRGPYQTAHDVRVDAKIATDWEAAKRCGTRRIADFCRDRNYDEDEVRAALGRHRKRK